MVTTSPNLDNGTRVQWGIRGSSSSPDSRLLRKRLCFADDALLPFNGNIQHISRGHAVHTTYADRLDASPGVNATRHGHYTTPALDVTLAQVHRPLVPYRVQRVPTNIPPSFAVNRKRKFDIRSLMADEERFQTTSFSIEDIMAK